MALGGSEGTAATNKQLSPPALRVRGLSKRFGPALVLDDVRLEVRAGEVHGLLGENGSGKSTLIKILAGYHDPEPGADVALGDQEISFPIPPGGASHYGISFVHQDLALVPSLTVLENYLVGSGLLRSGLSISWRRERARLRETLARYDVELDPAAVVSSLMPTERALLAIVRASEQVQRSGPEGHGRLLVLDEPSVFLPLDDKERLSQLVRTIAGLEIGVLLVSHDLDEIERVCDRMTILRDGRVQGTVEAGAVDRAQVIRLILGPAADEVDALARIDEAAGPHTPTGADGTPGSGVTVDSLAAAGLQPLSFKIRQGEVVGVTGLPGSGFDELPYLLFGAHPARSGELRLGETRLAFSGLTPATAVQRGIALVPGDRGADGVEPLASVADNMLLLTLPRYLRRRFLDRSRMRRDATELVGRFDIRPRDPSRRMGSLSGGNQQKAVMAKWLNRGARLYLLHEPTQGVDIGARQEIHRTVREVAADGCSVLCATTDFEELSLVADRVLVFAHGRIDCELAGGQLTKQAIARACLEASV